MKTYDEVIGSLIWNLGDLKKIVEEHEPHKVIEVEIIQDALEKLDYYMAHGEEPTQGIDLTQLAGVDFSFNMEQLAALGIRPKGNQN